MDVFIRQLLDSKGYDIWSLSPDSSVYEAIEMMANRGVGALAVMDGDKLVGMVSERDYARKVILKSKSSRETKVSEIMSPKVICVEPDRKVEEGLALMSDKRVRHLPVVEENKVIGMISIGDLVKAIIAEQKFIIDQLVRYIQS